jgi:tripartite-type tricarboxylate transporter receptor subunit TctC
MDGSRRGLRKWSPVAVAAALGALASFHAAAQEEAFPSKPIQMVIPVGGGGSTDIMLRSLASFAEPFLGQKIVIINRPGASGMIGVGAVARAPADGYTVGGVWSGPVTMAPHMGPAGYKLDEYVVLAMTTEAPGVFCVAPSFPANNGKEFLEELRRNPGKYTYGNEGIGGFVHLAGERIFAAAGVKALAVPFAGANQTATAFLGGNIDIFGGGISSIIQFVKQGKAKCLLVTSAKRHNSLPDVYSLADVGLAESETLLWRGVIAPAGMPPERVAKLAHAFREGAKDPKFKAFAESRGEAPWIMDYAESNKYVANEYRTMQQLVDKLGLKQKAN